ncbi:hypothetical protein ASZ90_010321 [hydrocarbon metagenome]|uniref:Uncharacterized protein n=1 Tax=hydrocarbon metagenome TaxID=938273 RepID=A0A0W8FGB6_9ZZZZ
MFFRRLQIRHEAMQRSVRLCRVAGGIAVALRTREVLPHTP